MWSHPNSVGETHVMRTITVLAVSAILLLEFSGAIPKSSVGGPLTVLLILVLAMLAVGIHEAWSNNRGVPGWIVSIVASVAGGFLVVSIGSVIMEIVLSRLHMEGSLASSRHALLYVSFAGIMILTLLGSWIALQIVNRFR